MSHPRLPGDRHRKVLAILDAGGSAHDVATALHLNLDAARSLIRRASQWRTTIASHAGDLPDLLNAACAGLPDHVFFPVAAIRGHPPDWSHARRVCAACPDRLPCADYATTRPDLDGMWGGLTPTERRDLRRQRRDTP